MHQGTASTIESGECFHSSIRSSTACSMACIMCESDPFVLGARCPTCSTASVSCFTAVTEAQPTASGYASSAAASSSSMMALHAVAEPWLRLASAAAAAADARRSCSGAQ